MAQRVTPSKTNFTAGELKPSLHAREDLSVWQNGAKKVENMIPLPEGGATRRSGTALVAPLVDQTRPGLLIPFKFSRVDARVLCLNAGVARVIAAGALVMSGGAPYSFAHPWTDAQLPQVRWGESAGDIFLADGLTYPRQLARLADANWSLTTYASVDGPTLTQNLDSTKTIGVSGNSGSIALTANFAAFQAGHVGSTWRLDESDLSLIPYWTADESVPCVASAAAAVPGTNYRRYQGNVFCALGPQSATAEGPPYTAGTYSAGVNAPTNTSGTSQSAPGCVAWQFMYAGYSFVEITAVTDSKHATATVLGDPRMGYSVLPDSIVTKPTYRWYEGAWSSVQSFPTQMVFGQQRLWFLDATSNFWGSYLGDYWSFLTDSTANSAITGQVLSLDGTVLTPQWAVSSGWVVIGCADCEPVIRGSGAYDTLTTSDIQAIVDKGQGSAPQIAAIADAGILNIGVSRKRLMYTKIDRLIETIRTDEISTTANHVLAGLAQRVVYQHDPFRVAWGFNADGALWSVTFRPDQQVTGWARHPMPNAYVEDMAAIPSPDGTAIDVYLIVRRVFGAVTCRFVELLQPFFNDAQAEVADATGAWLVDCAVPYAGAATTTLSGLPFPDGTVMRVLSNGQWLGDIACAGGAVALPRAVTSAVVGLPMKSKLRTLPLDPTIPGATSRAEMKQATHGVVDLMNTFGGAVHAEAFDEETGQWQRAEAPERLFEGVPSTAGAPTPLYTGRKSFSLDGVHGRRIELEIEFDNPYPATVLGLSPDINIADG